MNKNDFAKNPPMGWNSWDCYGASVTEKELKQNADYMMVTGKILLLRRLLKPQV